jgi:hypothetical protein
MQYEFVQENGVWKLYWGGSFGQETETVPVAELVLEGEEVSTVEEDVYVPTLSA